MGLGGDAGLDKKPGGLTEFFGSVGNSAFFVLVGIARLFSLFMAIIGVVASAFYQKKAVSKNAVLEHMVIMGVDSLPIICLVGASVGAVLALQAAYQLKMFGAMLYTGSLVSVSMTRELGPLIASIVISGRIGARMAAEIGTMKVQEEVDALTTMGISPIRFLVVPRCLALVIMLPCLAVMADVLGMAGGYLIGTVGLGINPDLFWAKTVDAMVLKDIYTGLSKSMIFAVLIALISCHEGLSVEGGADSVGKATTQAVVTSIVLIIVVDCLATAIFYYAFPS